MFEVSHCDGCGVGLVRMKPYYKPFPGPAGQQPQLVNSIVSCLTISLVENHRKKSEPFFLACYVRYAQCRQEDSFRRSGNEDAVHEKQDPGQYLWGYTSAFCLT